MHYTENLVYTNKKRKNRGMIACCDPVPYTSMAPQQDEGYSKTMQERALNSHPYRVLCIYIYI